MSGARAHHFRTAIDEQHEFLARIWRDACLVVLGTTGFIAAMIFALHLDWWAHPVDWDLYVSAAQRWLAGGSYFQARQLSGPYQMQWGDILYPPTALWVFVPLSFVPRIACLLLPVPVIVAALYRLRPALWAWALMGVLFVYDPLAVSDLTGDPLLWLWAALFAAVAFGTPASFLLLKPTLLPFALFGIRRRSWWLGLGLLALLSLPMLALDLTWVRVVLDARQPFGVFYSVHQWPCMAIPLVAWAGSVRRSMRGMAPHLGIPRGNEVGE